MTAKPVCVWARAPESGCWAGEIRAPLPSEGEGPSGTWGRVTGGVAVAIAAVAAAFVLVPAASGAGPGPRMLPLSRPALMVGVFARMPGWLALARADTDDGAALAVLYGSGRALARSLRMAIA